MPLVICLFRDLPVCFDDKERTCFPNMFKLDKYDTAEIPQKFKEETSKALWTFQPAGKAIITHSEWTFLFVTVTVMIFTGIRPLLNLWIAKNMRKQMENPKP
jgi:hypothetical protein